MNASKAIQHSLDAILGQWDFNFNFASGIDSYSTQYVSSSRRPFSTATRPAGHSTNASNAIRHSSDAIIGPWDLILILQVELTITALSVGTGNQSPVRVL